jgi:hypothetical protein
MILRIGHSIPTDPTKAARGEDAWPAFARTQQLAPGTIFNTFAGCISQPAHAALAAQLAKALKPEIFGPLPPDVIDAIGRHDAGWAGPDLAALEYIGEKQPQSFVTCPPEGAVHAWRKSISEAETRSPLAGTLTSRHFCLLAPHDNDPHHTAFVEQENQRRAPQEAALPLSRSDLDRFTSALGFCDLLSLCLCSGLNGVIRIPLAHPADPVSQHATRVSVSIGRETIRFDQPTMPPDTVIHVDGWVAFAPNVLASQPFRWTVA